MFSIHDGHLTLFTRLAPLVAIQFKKKNKKQKKKKQSKYQVEHVDCDSLWLRKEYKGKTITGRVV